MTPIILTKSTLNLKKVVNDNSHNFIELEWAIIIGKNNKPTGKGELTLWVGKNFNHCESFWSESISSTKFKRKTFKIPGYHCKFMLLSGKLWVCDL
jgi:hypothetical protein